MVHGPFYLFNNRTFLSKSFFLMVVLSATNQWNDQKIALSPRQKLWGLWVFNFLLFTNRPTLKKTLPHGKPAASRRIVSPRATCTGPTYRNYSKLNMSVRHQLYQEPTTPIISQCNGIFTDQSSFRYFSCEIGQFQST